MGNLTRQAVALANLAAIAARRGDGATAAAHGEHAIELQRANGDLDGMVVSLANLGRVRLALGDDNGARAALHEFFELGLRLEYRMLLAYLLSAAAELARRGGAPEDSAGLVGAGAALFEAIGMAIPQEEIDEHERTLTPLREPLGDDAVARLVAEGREAPVDGMIERALEFTL